MNSRKIRWTTLIALSCATTMASACQAVLDTIGLAFDIVDVWI